MRETPPTGPLAQLSDAELRGYAEWVLARCAALRRARLEQMVRLTVALIAESAPPEEETDYAD
jgi:hypothetical protein